jgi:hypothetical protein
MCLQNRHTRLTTWCHNPDENMTVELIHTPVQIRSWDSAVSITTGYRPDNRGGQSSNPGRVKNFLFSISPRPVLGPTQPPFHWILRALSQGVKWPGCEADHSSPTSFKVKKTWIYTSTAPYAFMT